MLKMLHKSLLIALLLVFSCSQAVHAQTKLYQYDGKLPFVQMMLNMMVAMGILDRLPANGGYGRSGFSNSYARPPWQQTPWSSSGLNNVGSNTASPIWGSPSWGVLPSDSYALNNNAMYDPYSTSSAWSSSDLDGWVNETWETSQWNPKAPAPTFSAQPNASLPQNFNYNVPESGAGNMPPPRQQVDRQSNRRSPLSRLMPPSGSMKNSAQRLVRVPTTQQSLVARAPVEQQRRSSPLHKKVRPTVRQKSCVTDSCGLQKPNLNGLWVAQNGEMLGVKNQRYLWNDGNTRYLTGQLLIQNEYLLANVEGSKKTMRFKYKLAGNHLLTLRPDGTIREFVRTSGSQYGNPYYGQQLGNTQGYY